MIDAPRKRIILHDGEQAKLDQPARDDEGFSPVVKIDDRPKGFVDGRKTEHADYMKSQTEFPIHGVMESGGSYNLHARIPADGGNLALPHLEDAARSLIVRPGTDPLVIAEYGCLQGKNSLAPIRAAIRCPRSRNVVHVDQHANDFNTLFDVLHNDSERYSINDF
jgi:hypothetical protein